LIEDGARFSLFSWMDPVNEICEQFLGGTYTILEAKNGHFKDNHFIMPLLSIMPRYHATFIHHATLSHQFYPSCHFITPLLSITPHYHATSITITPHHHATFIHHATSLSPHFYPSRHSFTLFITVTPRYRFQYRINKVVI